MDNRFIVFFSLLGILEIARISRIGMLRMCVFACAFLFWRNCSCSSCSVIVRQQVKHKHKATLDSTSYSKPFGFMDHK